MAPKAQRASLPISEIESHALVLQRLCRRSRTSPISQPTAKALSKPMPCTEVSMTKQTFIHI
jgi:hypothetical protein